jgi:RNA polymerase sigma-70 factor, ECF subfamily
MKFPRSGSTSRSDAEAQGESRRRFEALCTPMRADLLRFLLWLCHDRALAEDVMQETLLRAWRSFESLQDPKAAKPWLLTIARRELARVFGRKRLETVEVDALTEQDQDSLCVGDSCEVEEMRRAIMRLAPGYREPLILQVSFGYSTDEIARHMGLSLAAVLSRLFRARQLLRRQMLGAGDDEGSLS